MATNGSGKWPGTHRVPTAVGGGWGSGKGAVATATPPPPPQRGEGAVSIVHRPSPIAYRFTPSRPHVLRLTFLALALVLALLPTLVAADELDDRVRAVAKELRCPVCAGETVADSHSQVSIQMRAIIRQKLEAGETPAQIKAYFVERYGESVLLSPEAKGFTLGVWVMPVVALLLGLVIVFTVIRSWSRRGAPVIAATPAAPPARALPSDDDARLEEELANFRRTQGGVRG